MGRQVKCPYCELKLDKDDSVEYKKRYYHEECFETWRMEAEHRKELIEYICSLYKLDAPTGMMLKQIKEFQEDYKYKLKGIELALRYFHETLEKPVQSGTGIGIVPFVYEDAKKHFMMKLKVEESVEDLKTVESKSVTVQSPQFNYERKLQQIDIGSL
ncbi:hypothetical protein [uncultured Metabacillus sp.]|uniref:hypothetical protein n=1 Tax=Metabacillus sp. Hm71 TaxID=3450743 RepID=UPI002613B40E|nr:hypothetical protein [uncultured Metabacillus sp.]